jgi:hypothetical protein
MTTDVTWRGPEALRPLLVPLSAVTPWPENPRLGDAGAVAASLARFGQQKPIVVQKSTGWIVAGNHTWYAAAMVGELETALGFGPGLEWTHVAVVFSDLSGEEAKAYAIADNRTSDLGTYDDDRLAKILVELASAGQLVGTGYDGDDVDELLASLEANVPTDFGAQKEPELPSEVRVEISCSRDFLSEISGTLADWRARDGVEVSIA